MSSLSGEKRTRGRAKRTVRRRRALHFIIGFPPRLSLHYGNIEKTELIAPFVLEKRGSKKKSLRSTSSFLSFSRRKEGKKEKNGRTQRGGPPVDSVGQP